MLKNGTLNKIDPKGMMGLIFYHFLYTSLLITMKLLIQDLYKIKRKSTFFVSTKYDNFVDILKFKEDVRNMTFSMYTKHVHNIYIRTYINYQVIFLSNFLLWTIFSLINKMKMH